MANTYVTMQEVAEDLLIDFENNLLVTATTQRGYEDDITNAHTDTGGTVKVRSEEHTSELQSHREFVCRLLLEKTKKNKSTHYMIIRIL